MQHGPTHPLKPSAPSALSPLVALKDFDWRRLQRLTDPQTMKDLDAFLDHLPQRAGKNALIIAAVMWVVAAGALFLLFHDAKSLKDIQKQLSLAEANRITVPQLSYRPVDPAILKPIVEKLKKVYPSLTFELQNEGMIGVKALTTRDFPAWRSAIGDLAFGSPGWKLSVKKLCTGRGCASEPLQASIAVQEVMIQAPEPLPEDEPKSEQTTTP